MTFIELVEKSIDKWMDDNPSKESVFIGFNLEKQYTSLYVTCKPFEIRWRFDKVFHTEFYIFYSCSYIVEQKEKLLLEYIPNVLVEIVKLYATLQPDDRKDFHII